MRALTWINTGPGILQQVMRPCVTLSPDVDTRLTREATQPRFAVATFETAGTLRDACERLRLEGLTSETLSCLGQQRVIADLAGVVALPAAAQVLAFPDSRQPICCTAGTLAQALAQRAGAGAASLQAALSHWLIPRHAAQLQAAVDQGRVVLWVQIVDSEAERRAYRSLLAGSSQSVGVHDLVAR